MDCDLIKINKDFEKVIKEKIENKKESIGDRDDHYSWSGSNSLDWWDHTYRPSNYHGKEDFELIKIS
tara:strand:+ start:20372 stop:20572 length:201 start_codon:yes stop_codon:yes gene_type:complete